MADAKLIRRIRSNTDERSVIIEPTRKAVDLSRHAADIRTRIVTIIGIPSGQVRTLHPIEHARAAT